MSRECNCAGGCGPQHIGFEPIALAGTDPRRGDPAWSPEAYDSATMEWADWIAQQGDADELSQWKKTLHESARRVYFSDKHADARLPLGGIGTGNIEIGPDGQLTTWQLFNTLRDGYVPCFFAVKVGNIAKLLQTAGGPDLPRI